MTEKPRLSLTFGAMAEPTANQLAARNLAAGQDDLDLMQRLADSVALSVSQLIADANRLSIGRNRDGPDAGLRGFLSR